MSCHMNRTDACQAKFLDYTVDAQAWANATEVQSCQEGLALAHLSHVTVMGRHPACMNTSPLRQGLLGPKQRHSDGIMFCLAQVDPGLLRLHRTRVRDTSLHEGCLSVCPVRLHFSGFYSVCGVWSEALPRRFLGSLLPRFMVCIPNLRLPSHSAPETLNATRRGLEGITVGPGCAQPSSPRAGIGGQSEGQ